MSKSHHFHSHDSQRAARAASLAELSAFTLSIGKLVVFFMTGSFIVALSAWDSLMDTLVSLINRKIVKFARIDADSNHPYGHGRAESIASLGQGCFIFGGALIVFGASCKQIYTLSMTNFLEQKTLSFLFSIFFIVCGLISYAITLYLKKVGEKLNSPALLSDAEHYRMDLLTNISSAIAVALISIFSFSFIDPLLALIFSLFIMRSAVILITTSVHELMDHDIPEKIKKRAMEIVMNSDLNVIDIHNFRGRKSGHKYFFDFHVTLPHTLTFTEVHETIEYLEHELKKNFEGDVIIHPDPSNLRNG